MIKIVSMAPKLTPKRLSIKRGLRICLRDLSASTSLIFSQNKKLAFYAILIILVLIECSAYYVNKL